MSNPHAGISGPGFLYSVEDGWGHLQLDRPDAGNRVGLEMLVAMTELLRTEPQHAGVLLISAAGKDFCLGRERAEQTTPVTPFDAFRPVAAFYRALSEFPGLTIAAVQGRATGFGVGMALRTDLCLAADDASFTLDEIPHGIPPMFVLSELVDHLHPKHLMEMILTGRTVAAPEALAMGLVSRTAPAAELLPTARDTAAGLAGPKAPLVASCKQYIRQIRAVPHASRLDAALSAQTLYAVGN
ncbi:MAG: enoyl-CoA hydratase/isomerase family protein [Pigmentiphaga sp.]|uniref:enoyl-CoA hydratase/isomerase family protein n=1 Tax=Pigmentiphaga sp. TaxID=1977564 RepID=UPI0029B0E808|nr:enoyl-CoA hydratase/isomerase family protein [Pigmentiphaga sp.]MDX3906697.1 enoyl-CoA hydratase/isomerase family protein [Pigmentiphaga sp.]